MKLKMLTTIILMCSFSFLSQAAERVFRGDVLANTWLQNLLGVDWFEMDIYSDKVSLNSHSLAYMYVRGSNGNTLAYVQINTFVHKTKAPDYRVLIEIGRDSFSYGTNHGEFYQLSDGIEVEEISETDQYCLDVYEAIIRSIVFQATKKVEGVQFRKMNQDQRTVFDMICYAAGACALAPPLTWGCAPVAIGCFFTLPMATVENPGSNKGTGPGPSLNTEVQPKQQAEADGAAGSGVMNGGSNECGGSSGDLWFGGNSNSGDIC